MKIDVKILDPRMVDQLPATQRPAAPAWTCAPASTRPLTLAPNAWQLVPTGIAIWLKDPGFAALILPRSGLGHKHGIVLGNLVGLIDSDYQGQLMVSAWNRSDVAVHPAAMERLAQLVIVPVVQAQFNVVAEFPRHASAARAATARPAKAERGLRSAVLMSDLYGRRGCSSPAVWKASYSRACEFLQECAALPAAQGRQPLTPMIT